MRFRERLSILMNFADMLRPTEGERGRQARDRDAICAALFKIRPPECDNVGVLLAYDRIAWLCKDVFLIEPTVGIPAGEPDIDDDLPTVPDYYDGDDVLFRVATYDARCDADEATQDATEATLKAFRKARQEVGDGVVVLLDAHLALGFNGHERLIHLVKASALDLSGRADA